MQRNQNHHDHPHEPEAHEAHDPHPHDHDHEGSHDHEHHDHEKHHSHEQHDHEHGTGLWGWLSTIFHLHGHSHQHGQFLAERAFADNSEGIRAVWLSLAALGITSILQIVIFWWSGSVALLADTLHNVGDCLNSIPLLIAFYLARRAANRRYTYGFGRAEDVAGIFIVLSIAVSATIVFWESYQKFINLEPMTNLGWVAAAAIIGFLGNEAVATFQIGVGRKIGSAALVADGMHARTDGLTSLAVLVAAGGTWLGYPIVDPIIGVLIGIAILFITRDATLTMWYRLMDAIEPDLLAEAEEVIKEQPEIKEVRRVRLRWLGHELHAEVTIAVEANLTIAQGHEIAEAVRHGLFHEFANLSEIIVHVDPWSPGKDTFHEATAHHEELPQALKD
jgi:cation diffusion facilitator family transporter